MLMQKIGVRHAVQRFRKGGIGKIDVDKNEYSTFSYFLTGSPKTSPTRFFMYRFRTRKLCVGRQDSSGIYDTPSISAARLLRSASQQGGPIYTIDANNINTTISQLQVSSDVLDDIRNSINAGKKVIISKASVQYESLNSIGYIIVDRRRALPGI